MEAKEFRQKLKDEISAEEAAALRSGSGLYISNFNRNVCLRLLEGDSSYTGDVPLEKAEALSAELSAYLNEFMQDHPEGHKWIVLSCLYLTFVEHLPMHPQAAAKWVEKDGRYFCPSMAGDSLTCSCCVCEGMKY